MLWLVLVGVLTVVCGGNGADTGAAPEVSETIVVPVTPGEGSESDISAERVIVLGDSSLLDVLPKVSQRFQGIHPGVNKVQHEFATSQKLAKGVIEDGNANVLVSASAEDAKTVVNAGAAARSRLIGRNELAIAVPKLAPEISAFEDTAKPGISLAVPAENTTAGRYATEILNKAGADHRLGQEFVSKVNRNFKHKEPNVRAALARVREGDADAAIVYRTDVEADSELLEVVEIPEKYQVTAEYHVVALEAGGDPNASQTYADFLVSDSARELLQSQGFQLPSK